MKQTLHTLLFAFVLALICSSLLAGITRFTRPYREANEKAERVRNTLAAFDAPIDPRAPAAELLAFFDRHVRRIERDATVLYAYHPGPDDEHPAAVAIFIAGPGVWGPIEGVLALEPDLRTVRGVRFYRQEKTPGLGGEIATGWFQDQFRGKSIMADPEHPGIRIRPNARPDHPGEVDAVTGATMTSDRVEAMLNVAAGQLATIERLNEDE